VLSSHFKKLLFYLFSVQIYTLALTPQQNVLLLENTGSHNLSGRQLKRLVDRLAVKGFTGSSIASIASEASFGQRRSVHGLKAIRKVQAKDLRHISMMTCANHSVIPQKHSYPTV
jgi:hypothetical protein